MEFNFFSTVLLALILTTFTSGKRLRLPILLRSPKIECSFVSDECGINKSLEQFELYKNSTYTISGVCQYYQFTIKDNYLPINSARFQTLFFPNLSSNKACLHVEYNTQGRNVFLFAVSQRTRSKPSQVVYSEVVPHSSHWRGVDIDINLLEEDSQFVFETLCQFCLKGSKFSISRITFTWESCY